ncbi:MAG TPA: flagellar hook capping FlgD N-terminal domain-containing protein [Gemmatimonadaceae bacterium]|nr:flagellar hook capping FlgD N-terminal domain-containing protein [Gemmatimonadaceae bacterium]
MTTPITSSSAATQTAAAVGQATAPGGALGEDQFLQLLVAQLQNQDPLNPMDGDQMASELAQFSSLDQLTSINSTLSSQQTSQTSLLTTMQTGSAVNTIGHTVVAQSSTLTAGSGGTTTVMADIPAAGGNTVLTVVDQNGNPIATQTLGDMAGGRQSIDVSGIEGNLPAGTYSFTVSVTPSGGTATNATTYVTGKVDGVITGPNGLMLTAGLQQIPFANIVQIEN